MLAERAQFNRSFVRNYVGEWRTYERAATVDAPSQLSHWEELCLR